MWAEQRQSRLWFKANGLIRHLMVRNFPLSGAPKVVLTEYPKSGGTWISQMLSECLGITNPRNRIPPRHRCLIHGVHLAISPCHNTVVLWRDGRDIMVSFYYHILFDKPLNARWQAEEVAGKLGISDIYDIQTNLPRFIEYCFKGGYPGFPWNRFYEVWHGRTDCIHTSYESMTADPHAELSRLVAYVTGGEADPDAIKGAVDKFSFEALSNRARGTEDPTNFVRKGVPGDWRNKFTREACEVFDHYAGDVLVALEYEKDRSWVSSPEATAAEAP